MSITITPEEAAKIANDESTRYDTVLTETIDEYRYAEDRRVVFREPLTENLYEITVYMVDYEGDGYYRDAERCSDPVRVEPFEKTVIDYRPIHTEESK